MLERYIDRELDNKAKRILQGVFSEDPSKLDFKAFKAKKLKNQKTETKKSIEEIKLEARPITEAGE